MTTTTTMTMTMTQNRNLPRPVGVGIGMSLGVFFFGLGELAWSQPASCPDTAAVAREDQERARSLKEQAYQEHLDLRYDRAAELYRQAAVLWPRPELYRQAGMAYAQATMLLPAYEHLSHALRCGKGILSAADYDDAQVVMTRLQPWFAEIEVRCTLPDTAVSLNEEAWFTCPAHVDTPSGAVQRRVVIVGQHHVVAEKDGYIAMDETILVEAGQGARIEARLLPTAQASIKVRRWPTWKPWAVIGAGAAIGLIGGGFEWWAQSRVGDYDQALETLCENGSGCTYAEQDDDGRLAQWASITRNHNIAIGTWIAGGIAATAGLALVFLNQARTRPNPEAGRGRVLVQPMLGRDRGGASLQIRF